MFFSYLYKNHNVAYFWKSYFNSTYKRNWFGDLNQVHTHYRIIKTGIQILTTWSTQGHWTVHLQKVPFMLWFLWMVLPCLVLYTDMHCIHGSTTSTARAAWVWMGVFSSREPVLSLCFGDDEMFYKPIMHVYVLSYHNVSKEHGVDKFLLKMRY